jgi:hypothetical protein
MNIDNVKEFFGPSDFMEHEVLRPLSHIRANWELQIDSETGRYLEEDDSFAALFNALIDELADTRPPLRYHDNEDRLGEHVQKHLNWKIRKSEGTWVNQDGSRLHPSDYLALLEQGGFDNQGVSNLILAAAGRVHAAIKRGQMHFDDMERSHQVILAGVLAAILYHRETYEEVKNLNSGEQIAPADRGPLGRPG